MSNWQTGEGKYTARGIVNPANTVPNTKQMSRGGIGPFRDSRPDYELFLTPNQEPKRVLINVPNIDRIAIAGQ